MLDVLLPCFSASLKLGLPRGGDGDGGWQGWKSCSSLGSSHSDAWEHPEITRLCTSLLWGSRGLQLLHPICQGKHGDTRARAELAAPCRAGFLEKPLDKPNDGEAERGERGRAHG